MPNYYNSLAGISQYGILPISPGNTSDVRRERVRRGGGEDEPTGQKRPSESNDERANCQKKSRSGSSGRNGVHLPRQSLRQQVEERQVQGQQHQQPPQPGMRLGPSDPLPGPFFNLFDDDDDTEYEPGTEEEEDLSEEEEIEDEEEVDPEEWMLDLDKDFALPQGYVLPPYSGFLPSELQMFGNEPVANERCVNERGINEPRAQVPSGTAQSVEVTASSSKPRFIHTNHDIRYSVDPYHYTPAKTMKAKQSMRELLSQGRQEIESNREHATEDVSLKSLQEHYFNQLKLRNIDLVSMPFSTRQSASRGGMPKTSSRKPHNAGTTSKDVGIELQCLHCDREFRGPKASTHRQQHIKRMHPDKYVKLKG
ncbi:unnamed protein product [Cyberlindnera jadinii]|uniref:Uncharacterized protein n=1 Tax=Cyberlindnera jadinii (strain ATCC 18201 / CBS 1600 / BCRC 20928 / JCM 3617 / NBRC 0987 / NRRL Y-1542) TaxID=983966 RepID=A0A0H5C6K5_CYBJN|nr:unnamed protein product [Cyberlindnera jadinii]